MSTLGGQHDPITILPISANDGRQPASKLATALLWPQPLAAAPFRPNSFPAAAAAPAFICCKVYSIRELNKRAGRRCVHVEHGRGCKIYEDRPDTCRAFYCMWRVDRTLGPEWKPETVRFVVALDLLGFNALKISL